MALWTGQNPYATKKQLISSISGLYTDIQDLEVSTIRVGDFQVSTLTAKNWISTPELYVSSIIGGGIQVNNGLLQISTGDISLLSLSTLSLKGIDLGGIDLSFDLGLGNALGGFLGGLGALVGGAFIGVGTGVGLAVQGLETGLASLILGRGDNTISNTYETINGTTQLQISTLGNAYPLYSTIFRTVSSVSANQVPGKEMFVSSFFQPGTTCIRSVSDPLNLITGDSNLNTSTIQSFGQWVPFVDPTVTGEDIIARDAFFSSITVYPPAGITGIINAPSNAAPNDTGLYQTVNIFPQTYTYNTPSNFQTIATNPSVFNTETSLVYGNQTMDFISTPYSQYTSTIGNYIGGVYFLTSSITNQSTIPKFIYTGSILGGADIAVCEPDETGFLSTGTMDFVAQSSNIFLQWGLAVDNLNSTIAQGTSKRVSWDISANTSNFIDIPQPFSTIVSNTITSYQMKVKPLEIEIDTVAVPDNGSGSGWAGMAFRVNRATFGAGTTFQNEPNYPYQFNDNVFINGILEATGIIATSTIFATSTFVDTQISTASIIADTAIIDSITATGIQTDAITTGQLDSDLCKVSSLRVQEPNWTNLAYGITSESRHIFAAPGIPLTMNVGLPGAGYLNSNVRFDFQTDAFSQEIQIVAHPANKTVMEIQQSTIYMENAIIDNLLAENLVYGQATAVDFATSTINFGWTGNFNVATPVEYALNQTLVTAPGVFWTDYNAAQYQTLKLMNFCNTVNVLAQQFSTPLTQLNTSFGSSNIQGWASTIFFNNSFSPFARVNLVANAGFGELSLQAQTNPVLVSLNTVSEVGGVPVTVPVGSTYKFTSGGATWTTASNAPTPGYISYNNQFQMSMDFEKVNISTTDTLSLNAEKIELNGQIVAPNLQLSNIYASGFISTGLVTGSATRTTVNDSFSQPFQMFNTTTTFNDGLINLRGTVIPSRGFNLFNSYNFNEWNNTQFNIDTTVAAGRPTLIVGEVIVTSPPVTPYAGQFFINNAIDSPALVIPVYQNIEGVLSTIGSIAGNTYARVITTNGTNWTIQSNIPSPMGATSATYSNYYTVTMNSAQTVINAGMPLIYNSPSLLYNTNKVFFYAPQIRVATIDAPSFNTREAGMESSFYYDSNISFSKKGATSFWESAAFNPILNFYSNTYYSVAGWQPTVSLNRLRISGNSVSSWELTATPYPVGGGASDFVWGTSRYVMIITDELNPSGNLREDYLMIPRNYFNFAWQGQGPLN